jgi:hypothetical protein
VFYHLKSFLPGMPVKTKHKFIPAKINFDAATGTQASTMPSAFTTPGGYGDYNISANADTKVIQVAKGLAFIDLRKKQPLAQLQKIPTANDENTMQIQLPEGACIQISFLLSAPVSTHIMRAQFI